MKRTHAPKRTLIIGSLLAAILLVYLAVVATAASVCLCPPPAPKQAYLPLILNSAPLPAAASESGIAWLDYLNRFRQLGNVAPVTENKAWSHASWLHSRYMVKEDVLTHEESPHSPWYTAQGQLAAQNGNIAGGPLDAPDSHAIDVWMRGPFHAVSILDPRLSQVGFGSYREDSGPRKMAATLDVLRGRGNRPPETDFPLPFPKDGGYTWVTSHEGHEWPQPLSSCEGYSPPSGPPIILQLGNGALTPQVTATSFKRGNLALAHCVIDETSYTHPDATQQRVGRLILNSRDAVVIMPRHPLVAGHTYTASVTANGRTTTWHFTVVPPVSLW